MGTGNGLRRREHSSAMTDHPAPLNIEAGAERAYLGQPTRAGVLAHSREEPALSRDVAR